MVKLSLLLLVIAAALALASPLGRELVVHERLNSVPHGFTAHGPAPQDKVLHLRLALVGKNPTGIEDELMEISTPGNPRYQQFLSKEEVEAFAAPTQETLTAVNAYLAEHGVTAKPASPAGDWLSIDVPVAKANELFGAQFTTFTHAASGSTSVRTLEYSIPANLQGHLDFVHPTIMFSSPLSKPPVITISRPNVAPQGNLTSDAVPASCTPYITPACLQALYGIPAAPASGTTNNTLAVSGFIGQYANRLDLSTFLSYARPDMSSGTSFTDASVDGGTNPQGKSNAGVEANLDTQYTVGVATGVPVSFISVGGDSTDGVFGFLDIVNYLGSLASVPTTFTTSYGADEYELTAGIAAKLCDAYAQLGARGTSIFFSSGDGGVSGSQSQSCTTFVPTFPSGCPYLTSVGGTSGVPETAWAYSSGGFSNIFSRPTYQSSAVSTYLTQLNTTYRGLYNASSRAYPDVAAQGDNVLIAYQGGFALVAGTSCSSPIFASFIALINDQLITAGKPPLGFLNPLLYAAPARVFNNITTGSNPGCGTSGFPAAAGWNPVTGLGTPNFAAFRTYVGLP
ncbi:family S53 protease [Auriscalpium vulgare]|uniref:Family S53 protease n=1 Tax=Auriscalpium vulgare TaxID=40419 RepID=A0ACB8RQW2_9AGAM|nr:family S53 protease [Auriscalpium vulgare]